MAVANFLLRVPCHRTSQHGLEEVRSRDGPGAIVGSTKFGEQSPEGLFRPELWTFL